MHDNSTINYKISVIVPIYNVEVYLCKCIESILNQTYFNLQIILIDDGSTDKSGIICDGYAQRDRRVQVIHKENGGLVTARKAGLKQANGEFVVFVDGDDYVEETFVETLLTAMLGSDADFVHMGYIYEQNGNRKKICLFENMVYALDENVSIQFILDYILQRSELMDITPSIWSKLFKKEFIIKCYDKVSDSQSYGEDLINICVCLLEGKKISLLKETQYHYVQRCNSMTNVANMSSVMKMFDLYVCLKAIFIEYNVFKQLESQLKNYCFRMMIGKIRMIDGLSGYMCNYFFDNIDDLKGKKVIIYGAGSVGQDYYAQICRYSSCSVVGWVDRGYEKIHFDYAEVFGIETIIDLEYDLVLIAVKNKETAIQIKKQLERMNVPGGKILWKMPERLI